MFVVVIGVVVIMVVVVVNVGRASNFEILVPKHEHLY